MTALVVDAGGTRLKLGLVDSGRVVDLQVVENDDEPLLELIARAGADMLGDKGESVDAIGLCVPGLVDEDGTLVSLPGKHEGLEGTDLRSAISSIFSTSRVAVVNDAVAYALGEATAGAGRGARRSVVVTIGTGVGVTVVEAGAPVTRGIFGGGILGGFIPIDAGSGPRDSSGQQGTIEARCAANRLLGYCDDQYEDVPAVYAAHERGERAAIDGVDRYRIYLARALVALAHAHAPDKLILGGGPMVAGNPLSADMEEVVNSRLYGSYRVSIELAALGDTAALTGLASLLGASG